jgi:hypothetical protein
MRHRLPENIPTFESVPPLKAVYESLCSFFREEAERVHLDDTEVRIDVRGITGQSGQPLSPDQPLDQSDIRSTIEAYIEEEFPDQFTITQGVSTSGASYLLIEEKQQLTTDQ